MPHSKFIIANTEILRGTTTTINLELPKLYNTPTNLPIRVIRGRKDGPIVFISAAIHGDELNGIEIIRRIRKLNILNKLKGTLILVPIVNVYGIMNLSRYLPDRRDLNRSFPGSIKGSLASRVAKIFFDEIVSRCDLGIDLHTASIHKSNLPQVRTNIDNEYIYGKLSSYTANMFKKDPNKVIHQTIDEYILTDYKPIIHINYIFPNQQLHKEFYEDYQKNILDHEKLYQCKVTSDYSYDITQKQATKEQGINQYLKINNIPKNNTIAIGDSLNDIGMFEFCHTSFCMTHGYEEAKQKAA